jgi:uncharacterized tellurite resistance protein B-like protein
VGGSSRKTTVGGPPIRPVEIGYTPAVFGRWYQRGSPLPQPEGAEQLQSAVRAALPAADEETVQVVVAIAGLLGTVAYADREFSPEEQARVREELGRIEGISPSGIDAVCAVLAGHVREIATVQSPRYSRALRELADRDLRLQVLDILVALAAADRTITLAETNVMRQLATSLGLTQEDYNAAQAKFVELLAVLHGASTSLDRRRR